MANLATSAVSARNGFARGLDALAGFTPAQPTSAPVRSVKEQTALRRAKKAAKKAPPAEAPAAVMAPEVPQRDADGIRAAIGVVLKAKGVPLKYLEFGITEFEDYFRGISGGLDFSTPEHARLALTNSGNAPEIERILTKYVRKAQEEADKAKAAAVVNTPQATVEPSGPKPLRARLELGRGESWAFAMCDLPKLNLLVQQGGVIHADDTANLLALGNALEARDIPALSGIATRMGLQCIRTALIGEPLKALQTKARDGGCTATIIGATGRPSPSWDAVMAPPTMPKAPTLAAPKPQFLPVLTAEELAEVQQNVVAVLQPQVKDYAKKAYFRDLADWLASKGVKRFLSPFQDGTKGQGALIYFLMGVERNGGPRVIANPNPEGLGDEVEAPDAGLTRVLDTERAAKAKADRDRREANLAARAAASRDRLSPKGGGKKKG